MIPLLLGIFLLGLYTGKIGVFQHTEQFIKPLKIIQAVSGIASIPFIGLLFYCQDAEVPITIIKAFESRRNYFIVLLHDNFNTVIACPPCTKDSISASLIRTDGFNKLFNTNIYRVQYLFYHALILLNRTLLVGVNLHWCFYWANHFQQFMA